MARGVSVGQSRLMSDTTAWRAPPYLDPDLIFPMQFGGVKAKNLVEWEAVGLRLINRNTGGWCCGLGSFRHNICLFDDLYHRTSRDMQWMINGKNVGITWQPPLRKRRPPFRRGSSDCGNER